MAAGYLKLTIAAVLGALLVAQPAEAGDRKSSSAAEVGSKKVRTSSARRGGYSYRPEDTINTYGDSRTRYGSTNYYRFWGADRQSTSGPFDHGFFFDSGISPRGGDSPYMN